MSRLGAILRAKLSAKDKIKAISTYAIPVLTYTFGVIKWTNTDV